MPSHFTPRVTGGTPNDIWPRGLIASQVKPSGPRALAVEKRDRQAVELLVGALRDDLVDDLELLVLRQPAGDGVAHRLPVARQRGGKNLHAGEWRGAHEPAALPRAPPVCPASRPGGRGGLPLRGRRTSCAPLSA